MREGSEHTEQAEPGEIQRGLLASMLGSNWRYFAVAGCVAATGYIIWALVFFSSYQARHAYEREHASADYYDEAAPQIERECWSVTGTFDRQCAMEAVREIQTHEQAKHDLKAQQDMAEATVLLALLGLPGFVISIGGLWALVWTFREQRTLTEIQSRAYIELVEGHIRISPLGYWAVRVVVHNSGSTPAFNLVLSGKLIYIPMTNDKGEAVNPNVEHEINGRQKHFLSPTAISTIAAIGTSEFPHKDIAEIGNAKGEIITTEKTETPRIYIEGKINFEDAFGRPRSVPVDLRLYAFTEFGRFKMLGGSNRKLPDEYDKEILM